LPPESSSDGSSSLTTTEKTKKYYTPVVMRMATENDVPISELENGIYIIKIITDNRIISKRIIKKLWN